MNTIFREYYTPIRELTDRVKITGEPGIDVIIPILKTGELFERNLHNIYERIPVNRLLIGNGGSTDDILTMLKTFPRVEIVDQTKFKTLGYCLKDLIKRVNTERFIYLHSDVFLPENWYDVMTVDMEGMDWLDCSIRNTVLIEYSGDNDKKRRGTLPGSHMGNAAILKKATSRIDDDFVYRNEDYIITSGVLENGGKYGSTWNTWHYHQIMDKGNIGGPHLSEVSIKTNSSKEYLVNTAQKQVYGNIKYLKPTKRYRKDVYGSISILIENKAFKYREFKQWVAGENPLWLPYLQYSYIKLYFYARKIRKKFIRK